MQQHTFDTLSMARGYVAAGLSCIPIAPRTKTPYTALLPHVWDEAKQQSAPSWRPYQDRLPYDRELARWFNVTDAGLAIVCGAVSGGLVVLDLESEPAYADWWANALDLFDDVDLLDRLPVVATGKGRHVYFRMADPIGNRKLASAGGSVIAETRGAGGYVLAPPALHPSGAVYQWLRGDPDAIPLLDAAQVQAVLNAARALQPVAPHPASHPPAGGGTEGGGNADAPSVIAAFNERYTIESVLERHGYTYERPGRYIRPGGERSSVQIRNGRSAHYNTADPLHQAGPDGTLYSHSAFSAFSVLEHQGDATRAVRAAARDLGLSPIQDTPDLLKAAGRAVGLATAPTEAADTWPYFLHEGGMWMQRVDKEGTPRTPLVLGNFTARIVAETTLHDGEDTTEFYRIEARCGTRVKTLDMARSEFEGESSVSKIVAALGARARINPAAQARYVLDAIKAFSTDVEEHIMHNHTGWVDGRYLFGNGYVDATGWQPFTGDSASRAHLPPRLARYRLTPPAAAPSAALALFADLLEVAPTSVTVPLVGSVLLAPLLHLLDAPAPMIHLYGPTGSHKTSLACVALALWGDFAPAHPTDTWTSTANSVQRLGWHLKDAPMLLDDYKAANVKANQVTFLLQNYGDGMARGRLDSNSEARSAYPIRGVLLSSGEDQPEGEASTLARILSVPLTRGAVHRGKLTVVQDEAPLLHLLTIGYLQWLASQPDLAAQCRSVYQHTRSAILPQLEQTEHATNPGRIASNVAVLYVAWDACGRFLRDAGLWRDDQVLAWVRVCKQELFTLAKQQIELTTGERYSQLFLDAVRALLASGRAYLLDAEGEQPEPRAGQVLLGVRDRKGVYLITDVAYGEVCKHARSEGRAVGYSKRALSQLLYQDGMLLSTDPPSLVVQKWINGARPWCWHMAPSVFDS